MTSPTSRTYTDDVYGRVVITEPVLCALLESAAVARLRGVRQHGITAVIGVTSSITRYEHSVGAMLLVRLLGGSLEEQIAALLHDISHTAFSHVIDHVLDSAEEQSYHDRIQSRFVAQTDLPALLAEYGYAWQIFLDEEAYRLLEQPAPALCADRIDYCLRDALSMGLITAGEVADFLTHLTVYEGQMVMDDKGWARWLADIYQQMDEASWANFWEVGLYEVTARALRACLTAGVLTLADFEATDAFVWQKMQGTGIAEIERWVALIRPETNFVWDEAAPDFWVETKIRTLDPGVLGATGMVALSQLDRGFAYQRQVYQARKGRPWPMRAVAVGADLGVRY